MVVGQSNRVNTKQSVLIAGGGGFVGKNMVEALESEYRICVVDKHIDPDFFREHGSAQAFEVDLNDSNRIRQILDELKPTYVINLISIVTAERDLTLFPKMVEVNLQVLLSLYDVLKDQKQLRLFVQFGSAEEYGNTHAVPFSEEAREYPASPYALIKQLTSNLALMLHRNEGFPAAVVRPGNLFGRYQPSNKLIPYLYNSLRSGKELLLTPGEQQRDFIHVTDLVEATRKILENPDKVVGSILNIAYGEGVTVRQLVDWMKERINSSSRITYGAIPYRDNEMMQFRCDISRLRENLGVVFTRNTFSALDQYFSEMEEDE